MFDFKSFKTAVKKGEYKISYEEPDNVCLHTCSDGTEYYVIYGDDCGSGVDAGSCTVEVAGHTFVCDLNNGEWFIDDHCLESYNFGNNNEEPFSKYDIIDILEDIPEVLFGTMLEPDEQMEVFYKANPDAEKLDYYWYEDEDRPRDDEEEDEEEEDDFYEDDDGDYVDFKYKKKESDEWEYDDLYVSESDLYDLYLAFKHFEGKDGEVPSDKEHQLSDSQIKDFDTDLYNTFLSEIPYSIENKDDIEFVVSFYADLFDKFI
ncbi:MAG: hypothetical protein PUE90_07920 [Bacteroidales bacterium]|nr:hypothetical protein [Bacteroidales bacterium]